MLFLQPAGAWALMGVVAIAALYLLKRRYTQVRVPSTYLWRRALEDHLANKPMQKLKRNLLMALQLLIALLLALSLMRPAASFGAGGEAVFIFDLSASMQARGRMAAVKDRALSLLDRGLAAATVIGAGAQVRPIVARSGDKAALRQAIADLRPENGGASVDQALSLARAMAREVEGLQIYVFSDDCQAPPGADYAVVGAGPGQDNRAILSFALTDKGAWVTGVVQVANYGARAQVQVEAYADGTLADLRTLDIAAGGVGSVQVTLPTGTTVARAHLAGSDAIQLDDDFWGVLDAPRQMWVAFGGADNIFAETALALRDDIRLYRTGLDELTQRAADLYVASDPMLTLSATGHSAIQAGPPVETGGALTGAPGARALLDGVDLSDVALRKYRPLTGGTPILLCGTDVVAAMDEDSAVLGFDLHDSNLPLSAGFPLLMTNLLDKLLPRAGALVAGGDCGTPIDPGLPAGALSARVTAPSGAVLAPPCVGDEAGLYRLDVARTGGDTLSQYFSMHIPTAEGDVRMASGDEGGASAGGMGAGRDWTGLLMLAAFVIMMVEWGVGRRGL